MGEALARQRAEAFGKQQDAAYAAEMKTKHLFSDRPEVFHTDYPCRLITGQSVTTETEVILRRASADGGDASSSSARHVEVIWGNQLTAMIQDEAGLVLSEIMGADPLSREGVPARVISVSPLDGYISVRCIEEKQGEKQ